MGTDLTRPLFGFDPICAHPWLKQLRPTENVEEPKIETYGYWRGLRPLERSFVDYLSNCLQGFGICRFWASWEFLNCLMRWEG
jgi:hypothetical protein